MNPPDSTGCLSAKDYASCNSNDWCAGCGDYGILRAIELALAEKCLPAEQVAVFGGIGCSGKTPYYLSSYGVHTLHGRVLPFAAGAKLARPELTVIAVGGDGDGLSIGAGHFVNAGRRNLDLTYILFNNGVYGLTKGQASPTLRQGEQTKAMAQANVQAGLNAVQLALTAGYSWVARGYAYDVKGLAGLIQQAIGHPGTAFLEVLQPCPRYNDVHTQAWYEQRLYALDADGHDPLVAVADGHDVAQQRRLQAIGKAMEWWGDHIPVGVFLQDLSAPAFSTLLEDIRPGYGNMPPARLPVCDADGMACADLGPLFEEIGLY